MIPDASTPSTLQPNPIQGASMHCAFCAEWKPWAQYDRKKGRAICAECVGKFLKQGINNPLHPAPEF